MVPVDALPPATPFTIQVTDWFVAPRPGALTAAVYCAVWPRFTVGTPDTVTASDQIGRPQVEGQLANVGWNGGCAGTSPNMAHVFSAGYFTIFKAAPIVSVGAVPP